MLEAINASEADEELLIYSNSEYCGDILEEGPSKDSSNADLIQQIQENFKQRPIKLVPWFVEPLNWLTTFF